MSESALGFQVGILCAVANVRFFSSRNNSDVLCVTNTLRASKRVCSDIDALQTVIATVASRLWVIIYALDLVEAHY